jgi:uncharacterized protein (TIGR00255 family)
MTAFARTEQAAPFGTLQVEIRSVNQRYLEPHFRLHESLRDLEPVLREALRTRLARGKVECSVRFESADTAQAPAVNAQRLKEIADALVAIQQQVPGAVPPTTLALLNQPGVMETQHLDQDAIKAAANALFDQALDELIDARAREGDKLAEMITTRLEAVSEQVATVRSLLPQILERQRAQLLERLDIAKTELDPQRLEAELVLVAQKADVDGAGPPHRAHRRSAPPARPKRPQRPPLGLPDAGAQPRSEYALIEIRGGRDHPLRGGAEGVDRADAGADSEY